MEVASGGLYPQKSAELCRGSELLLVGVKVEKFHSVGWMSSMMIVDGRRKTLVGVHHEIHNNSYKVDMRRRSVKHVRRKMDHESLVTELV
ncbi:hypothetical protein VNO78_19433 [Psophocarpus tetragonolobus]|uniref:Uncharacterized protein n=1 Tax=Psophocarpus tetragonolobus TaxID=3891 RepID=A0AAN9S8Q3_PSOTE